MATKDNTMALAALAALAVAGVGVWVYRSGGFGPAASKLGTALGETAVRVADGATTAVVGEAGKIIGLPTPDQTVTTAAEARWLIDNVGTFEASKWSSAGAWASALFMPTGSGIRPEPNTAAGQRFANVATDTGDESARLLRRYPMPSDYSGAIGIDLQDQAGYVVPSYGFGG